MSYLPKHNLYMPPGSYTILPKGAFEKDIEKMDSERYARLSNANVIFWQPISKELRQRFIEEYEFESVKSLGCYCSLQGDTKIRENP